MQNDFWYIIMFKNQQLCGKLKMKTTSTSTLREAFLLTAKLNEYKQKMT